LISHLTGQERESLRDKSAAIGVTIVRSTHEAKGTRRKGAASFEPGGAQNIFA
jgi:hypothetical protein